jgi:hypothetical protein
MKLFILSEEKKSPGMCGNKRLRKVDNQYMGCKPKTERVLPKDLPERMIKFYNRPAIVDGKPNSLPRLIDFCDHEGLNYGTVQRIISGDRKGSWPELVKAWNQCREYVTRNLTECALQGKTNAIFAIFAAKNMIGWRDKQDIELKTGTWVSVAKEGRRAKE